MMDNTPSKDYPLEVEELNSESNPEIKDILYGEKEKMVRIGAKKYLFQYGFLSTAPSIYNMTLRSDDTFVITFPRSGTTMTQELVWLLLNNLDYEKAKSHHLNERFPFLELSGVVRTEQLSYTEEQIKELKKTIVPLTIKQVDNMPSPRFLKSHLPLSLLPPSLLDETKVVYMARDPRDVAVSFYHHNKLMKISSPDIKFEDYWKLFINDMVICAPFFQHVLEFWNKRNHPNLLFLFYEEVVQDFPRAIRVLADFFGKTFSDEQVNKLADHLYIDNFKKNKSVNMENLQQQGIFTSEGSFIRKGKAGGWREYFDEEMAAQADEWIAKHLRGTDLRFPDY